MGPTFRGVDTGNYAPPPPGEISANVIWEKYKKCAEKRGKMRKEKEGRQKLRVNLK
jgi:hypothetical protein